MEKNDLEMLRAENDRLMAELEKLKQRLREEIHSTQASVRLDLNLEKGRLRGETGQQESKIREVETRIETDIAALRTAIQTSKVFLSLWCGVVLNGRLRAGYNVTVLGYFRCVFRRWQSIGSNVHPFLVTGCSALLMAYLRFRM